MDFDKLQIRLLEESDKELLEGALNTVVNASRMDCSSLSTEKGWVP